MTGGPDRTNHPVSRPADEHAYVAILTGLTSPQPPHHEIQLVARIARYLSSTRILSAIAERPKWYGAWEVREALVSNPGTPPEFREPIETGFAILDLMREMDGLSGQEKTEIKEDVRSLIRGLPPVDCRMIEERLRGLVTRRKSPPEGVRIPDELRAAVPKDKQEAEGQPAIPDSDAKGPRSPTKAPDEAELLTRIRAFFFLDEGSQERRAEARTLYQAIHQTGQDVRARVIADFGPFWQGFIREVMDTLPGADTRVASETAPARDRPGTPPRRAETHAREQKTVEPREEDELPAAAASRETQAEAREDRAALARSTQSEDELSRLAFEADVGVFEGFLENPMASEEQVAALCTKVPREKLVKVAHHRKWFSQPGVRQALLKNPNTPEDVALQCLSYEGRIASLSRLIHDPRVRSLNVKASARQRLTDRYKALSVDERAHSIKSSGGQLLQDLWNDAFSDRQTLQKIVSDHGVDERIVLQIARSRIAPREVLVSIGKNRRLLSSYQVCMELAHNPKTPREVLARVIPRLKPQDRVKLRKARGLSDHTRQLLSHG